MAADPAMDRFDIINLADKYATTLLRDLRSKGFAIEEPALFSEGQSVTLTGRNGNVTFYAEFVCSSSGDIVFQPTGEIELLMRFGVSATDRKFKVLHEPTGLKSVNGEFCFDIVTNLVRHFCRMVQHKANNAIKKTSGKHEAEIMAARLSNQFVLMKRNARLRVTANKNGPGVTIRFDAPDETTARTVLAKIFDKVICPDCGDLGEPKCLSQRCSDCCSTGCGEMCDGTYEPTTGE